VRSIFAGLVVVFPSPARRRGRSSATGFAARAIFNMPMGMIYRGVLPFIAVNFIALLVITYVPAISMTLIGTGR
jgi:hypothetical protein